MSSLSISYACWRAQFGDSKEPRQLDAVVIGSGYGGSVAALRLAEMGYDVTLLERGSEFKPGEFPNDMSQLPKFVRLPSVDGQGLLGRANGLFEWRLGPGVASLVGNGLGGGSLINAGVVMQPDPEVFAQEQWPRAIRLPAPAAGDSSAHVPELDRWFRLAKEFLRANEWKRSYTKTVAFKRLARAMRFPTDRAMRFPIDIRQAATTSPVSLTIDEGHCNDCGDCASGCNVPGAKLTLRDTYLAAAREKGAKLVHDATVWTVAPVRRKGSASGDGRACALAWRLRVLATSSLSYWPCGEDAAKPPEGFDIEAKLVVLAAGTFGSTELLQRSRDRCGARWWISGELGNHFSGNGDSLCFIADDKDSVNAVGMGADKWLASQATRTDVGPTITRQINLRKLPKHYPIPRWKRLICLIWECLIKSPKRHPIPLRKRLTIEDGAVPGAVARAFVEMLSTGLTAARLEHWRTGPRPPKGKWFFPPHDLARDGRDPLAAGHERRGQNGEEANRSSLAYRSHVVLTMGHDESRGRIVWVPGRDASVPYWEHPEELETYRVQEELFQDAARRLGAEWVPNPAWRILPKAASQVMSGPSLSTNLMTVHPLGGCVMGDDPRQSVVDDVGRLWRSDRHYDADCDADWARHENFLVLDGSIVPTAVGVNPMLTITALAERAMDALKKRRNSLGAVVANTANAAALQQPTHPTYTPAAWVRRQEQTWNVTMRERLVCENLQLRDDLQRAFGASSARGELNLELEVDNWLELWEVAAHPVRTVRGALRLQAGIAERPMVATYCVNETVRCELLAVSPYGPKWWPQRLRKEKLSRINILSHSPYGPKWWPWPFRWIWKILPWLRTLLTYAILRLRDIWAARKEPGQHETWLERWSRRAQLFLSALRQFGHSAERRGLYYHLRLTLNAGNKDSTDPDERQTAVWYNNLPHAEALPREIEIIGTKRVEYPATWRELARWLKTRLTRMRSGAAATSQPLPRLRESFLEQAGHLIVRVPGKGRLSALLRGCFLARLRGRFLVDFSALLGGQGLLREPSLSLGPRGDLTSGLLALSAYPNLLLRFILKTRLPDFRLPNYSQVPLPDMATDDKLMLKPPTPGAPPVQRYVFEVPRGESSSDAVDVNPNAKFELVLWRYPRPDDKDGLPELTHGHWYGKPVQRLRSVLLVHAFAQSGYSFTMNTLRDSDDMPVNLAGKLYQDGYEVWVLEHRLSTRLPIHEEPSTLDQIAQFDLPKAVDHVLKTLTEEFQQKRKERLEFPQIHVFAHCLGGAALGMSLLAGFLHYEERAPAHGYGPAPRCSKLASAIISQTHPLCIGQPGTQARTWIPAFVRDALGYRTVPFAVRGPIASLVEAWMDRIFAALPIPDDEQCPRPPTRGGSEDDCATCRRVRFIEAPLFKHCHLNPETHRELPLHFGKANVRVFAHAAKCVEAERLVDEDGQFVYVNEKNVYEHAALPVAFLHGEENELFHPESARRTATLFARLHPDWADLAAKALEVAKEKALKAAKASGKTDASPDHAAYAYRAAWFVAGHGHYDVLIGEKAPELVYPGIVHFFDVIQREADQGTLDLPNLEVHAALRLPRLGPMMSPVHTQNGHMQFRVSFMVDDRFSDGKQGPDGPLGTRCWAYARVHSNSHTSTHCLDIVRRAASARSLASQSPYRPENDDATAYRFAVGNIVLTPSEWPPDTALKLELFSVHECLVEERGTLPLEERDTLPLHAALQPGAPPLPRSWQAPHPAAGIDAGIDKWLDELIQRREKHLEKLAADRLPLPNTVSRVRLQVERGDLRSAQVPAAARRAALLDISRDGSESISFLASTCRYPGFPFDRHRAEHAVQRVLRSLPDPESVKHPAFALFVGDQIYADATAGIVDPLNPTERFVERHRSALSRALDVKSRTLGDLLARLPVVMTPDDHEYIDSYPAKAPLVLAPPHLRCKVQIVAQRAAEDAWRFFQSACGDVGFQGWMNFDAGPLRVLVLDSRSYRPTSNKVPPQILSKEQRTYVESWLGCEEAQRRLNVIVTGSVVLPGLWPDADPANPGPLDTFQWAPEDRHWLLTKLAEACRAHPNSFRFVLLSGDYHVSLVSYVKLDNRTVGIAIVVPPVYAPMPYMNATPDSIELSERISITLHSGAAVTWSLEPFIPEGLTTPVLSGSAIAQIYVRRMAKNSGSLYEIQMKAHLADYGQGDSARMVSIPATL